MGRSPRSSLSSASTVCTCIMIMSGHHGYDRDTDTSRSDNDESSYEEEHGRTPLAPQLQQLRDSLVDKRPPYCSGVLPVLTDELILYYGKEEDTSRRLHFLAASDEALEHLAATCDPASFGLIQKDVLDESYRKAGKLDSTCFSTKLDVDSANSSLMEAVRFDLLPGHQCRRQIKAELYKLNVYGRGSFFKAHKDTPRGPTMFGSLVVVLPAQHEGGALLLRHGGAEWTVDSAQAISEHSVENPQIAYAAFFSDVEHEVSTVTSGHRVTITYNLYFDDEEANRKAQIIRTLPPIETSFSSALLDLLKKTTFLPEGGHIGFGLNHEYPIETRPIKTTKLNRLKKCLKGTDAVVFKVCQELGLDVQINMFYSTNNDGLLLDHERQVDRLMLDYDESIESSLQENEGARIVESYGDRNRNDVELEVLWATKRTPFNQIKAPYAAYGNSVSTEYVYGQFCIVVHIGPVGNRCTLRVGPVNKRRRTSD